MMDEVELQGSSLQITRLGFGCARLMARIGRRDSVRLLRGAYDAGITHFDTARLYGYGEAESALGDLIASVGRNRVTVATKFGILPPRRTPLLSAAKSAARVVAKLHPSTRAVFRRRAASMTRASAFDTATARTSVEASLRALRTDRIDLLLLHECTPDDLTDELLMFVEGLRRAGTIRAHGIATKPDHAAEVLRRHPAFAPVVQTASSVWEPAAERLAAAAGGGFALITHSALGAPFLALCERLAARPETARRWSEALGIDSLDQSALAGLVLAASVSDNPRGAVVFSAASEAKIAANARAAGTAHALSAAAPRIEALRALLRGNEAAVAQAEARGG